MRYLVTGATGFVGRHMVELLLEEGHEVLALGTDEKSPFGKSVEYAGVDLLDENALGKIDLKSDAVIHLAGLAAVGPSFINPKLYMKVNTGIQINLFEECLRQKIYPRFLLISSASVYQAKQLPVTEKSPLRPTSPYSVSKLCQEYLGQYYTSRGFEVIIARPFNHIGPGQAQGFIAPDLARQVATAEADGLPVRVGNLKARRDYTDVRDIVRAYYLLSQSGKSGEVYNICSGEATSGQEILDTLLSGSKTRLTVKEDPAKIRPVDIPEIYGSYDKLRRHTGWSPQRSVKATLMEVLEEQRKAREAQ